MRYFLLHKVTDVETAARWVNELQCQAETMSYGIPVMVGSDPRHGARTSEEEYDASDASLCSKWPQGIGLSATFSPDLVRRFGEIVAKEYRALGITVALSPQVDLASDPRWMRYGDTFGPELPLVIDLGKAYCDGLQTTPYEESGWGRESVMGMAKHWPGGGTGEGGRDAHYPFGKYAVYPGENFEQHLKPFTEGVFQLEGPTKEVGAVMPYYSVSWKQKYSKEEEVGNAYNEYIIKERLRKEVKYQGIVCTDWGITDSPAGTMDSFGSRCYGVERLSSGERHLMLLMNGVDQFGGNSKTKYILEAYEIGCKKYGQEVMRKRMEQSATRLLEVMFRLGLFENPFLNPEESKKIVGCKEWREEGYLAQLQSIVLLKNKNECLPLHRKVKVYIPERKIQQKKNFFRGVDGEKTFAPVEAALVNEYFELVDLPEKADVGIVFLDSPITNPYSESDRKNGGNGYLPISLQYRPYTANFGRKVSIAGGDFREGFWSRSYHGKTVSSANIQDLYNILTMRKKMGRKPIIACIHMKNPTVLQEIEPHVDGILVEFGVEPRAIFDILSGKVEPEGALPMNLPKNMETVERHCEDVADDMEVFMDSEGSSYSFGFGLNWSGKITAKKIQTYKMEKSMNHAVR